MKIWLLNNKRLKIVIINFCKNENFVKYFINRSILRKKTERIQHGQKSNQKQSTIFQQFPYLLFRRSWPPTITISD
jgi:hypothetical protein